VGGSARGQGDGTGRAASASAIKAEGFSAQLEQRGVAVVVSLRGNADMAVHEQLKVFLDDLHAMAKATRAKEAVFEFEELYFMNSSCLSLLLRFINAVVGSQASQQFLVKFKSNPKLRWQQKSLEALRAYAQDHVFIE
jgi:anti-anti-sigma factor